MKTRRWLLLLLIMIVAMMSLATYTGTTSSLFTDGELSTDNALSISWTLPTALLTDGFEDTDPPGPPWDGNWDGNGATPWLQVSNQSYSGSYSARGRFNAPGDLTSDDLDASSAVTNIVVEFWFRPRNLEIGDVVVEIYNGSAWVALYDLSNGANNTWSYFSQTITDSQYFISNFKIRFNGTALADNDVIFVDDILIKTNQ